MMTETITVDPVTRIEGHSEIDLIFDDGAVKEARFSVKTFRGFEKFLVGQPVEKLPEMTARICGICYTVHSLASCKAIEDGFGIDISPQAYRLREFLQLGNFIESHTLSIAILSLPDIVYYDKPPEVRNVSNLLKEKESLVREVMKLRQAGSVISKIAGRRQVHPVSPTVGGMTKPLTEEEADEIRSYLDGGLETLNTLWEIFISNFSNNIEMWGLGDIDSSYLSIVDEDGVEFYDGDLTVVDESGEIVDEFSPGEYLDYVDEEIKDYSYMKFPLLKDGRIFRVGPLARMDINKNYKTPIAREMFETINSTYDLPLHNTMSYHLARIMETVYSVERALGLLEEGSLYSDEVRPETYEAKEGQGIGIVEAPRGTLAHIYDINRDGFVEDLKFYVATQHNNFSINSAITETAKRFIKSETPEEKNLNKLEMIVRAYDPCLACATHSMGRSTNVFNLYTGDGELVRRI